MKKKNTIRGFDGLIYFFKMCFQIDKVYIIYLFIQQLCKAAVSIAAVMIPQYIIDNTFYSNNIQKALFIAVMFSFFMLAFGLLGALSKKIVTEHRTICYKEFELKISKMMMEIDYERIENENFLNTKNRAEKFIFGDGRGFASVLENSFELISNCITLIFLSGVIVSLNPIILIMLLFILVINVYSNFRTQNKAIGINREKAQYERWSSYYSTVAQDHRYGKEIRGYNSSKWFLEKYKKQLDAMQVFYKKLANNLFQYDLLISITSTIQQIVSYIYVIVCGVKGIISIGQFSMYLSSITTFSSTLKAMATNIVSMQQYTQYYNDYKEYIAYQTKAEDGNCVICEPINSIEFKNVSFRYQGQKKYALRNINLKINDGDKILFVGENGAGKTTLIKLLLKIYKPTEGVILLNGKNIDEYSNDEYIKMFATVFQDYKLFACSVKENISMSDNADNKEIDRIMKEIGISEKIESLVNGVETSVFKEFDSNGFVPSGGEGQKIAMCRALYKDSQIIVLDEPTAALDPKSEAALFDKFDEIFKDKTILYISHRLSSAHKCNRVVSLKSGVIIEDSTHENLINTNSLYGELFKIQAEKYAIG